MKSFEQRRLFLIFIMAGTSSIWLFYHHLSLLHGDLGVGNNARLSPRTANSSGSLGKQYRVTISTPTAYPLHSLNCADPSCAGYTANIVRTDKKSLSCEDLLPSVPRRKEVGCYSKIDNKCVPVTCSGKVSVVQYLNGFLNHTNRNYEPIRSCESCAVHVSRCAVSFKHRFIYIPVPRSASTSIREFLRRALCQNHLCNPSVLVFIACRTALREFPAFFKWSFVRHPLARAASEWAAATRPRASSGAHSAGLSFDEWASDPNTTGRWHQQADFLADDTGCPLYDFVGVLDGRFAEDMEAVLGRIAAPPLVDQYRRGAIAVPRAMPSPGRRSSAALCGATAAARRRVAEWSRDDYRLFGFLDRGADPKNGPSVHGES